ncbi:MAG: Rieske 2Fe-2S domain-containing protein [Desulfurococcales archaeon]|nr:Rieske 2Fe-2S domain-containing protein [Desulfurococcales archaeon]
MTSRRDFLKVLGAFGLVGVAGGLAPPIIKYVMPPIPPQQPFPRTKLVWEDGTPVKASELEVNKMYLFAYPMVNTPNFLLNLGDENGNPVEIPPAELPISMDPTKDEAAIFKAQGGRVEIGKIEGRGGVYQFPGGVGPHKSVVAYSAICQHFACFYPALKFFPPGVSPPNPPSEAVAKGGVIFCACHGSAYDPYRGAIVTEAPAASPLPAVILEWDPNTDELWAVRVEGATITGKFCNTCAQPEEMVGNTTTVRQVA